MNDFVHFKKLLIIDNNYVDITTDTKQRNYYDLDIYKSLLYSYELYTLSSLTYDGHRHE